MWRFPALALHSCCASTRLWAHSPHSSPERFSFGDSSGALATETVIGVVFSAALAIGALLTTGEQLVDALFGGPGTLSPAELIFGLAGAAAVIGFVLLARDRLVVTFLSAEVAVTAGINVRRLSLLYLIAFALTVALGLRYLGAVLMGSLIIIPAATARQLATNLTSMLWMSVTLALVATLGGTWLAAANGRQSGPLIVGVAAGCFLVALMVRRAPSKARSRMPSFK